jgi:hypothetical protein
MNKDMGIVMVMVTDMDTDTTREINRNRDIDIDTNMDKDMDTDMALRRLSADCRLRKVNSLSETADAIADCHTMEAMPFCQVSFWRHKIIRKVILIRLSRSLSLVTTVARL